MIDYINYKSPVGKSDHVCLTWNITVAVGKPDVKQEAKLNYWKSNYDAISEGLQNYDWGMEFRDKTLQQNWSFLKDEVMELVKQFVPLKKPYCGKKSADWMTKQTKKLIKDRNQAWTRYRHYSSYRNYLYYKKLLNKTVQSVRKYHDSHRKKVIRSFKGNPKKFFGFMRNLQTVKLKVSHRVNNNGDMTVTEQETAEVLCEFF